ncbi:lytic polysaccharide monooxygenase [Cellulomonas sp. NPDC089187]|uniref:lytic polysaccharide monooxygenase n=1 Tax=Cellulomonas sp. NPDC089187 TaxID=3154970 RepID=UPI0034397D90
MNRRQKIGSAVTALAVAGALGLAAAPAAQSHGYIGGSNSQLIARAAMPGNTGLGAVQYEPQSIEGPKGFPAQGPADGTLASGGNTRFSELDQQSSTRWVKNQVTNRTVDVAWNYTALHATTKWEYYITKPGWNQNAPLTRSSLELIKTVPYNGALPVQGEKHTLTIPADRTGYHVIYAVWVVDNTTNAFYNTIDVTIQ